MKAKYSSSAFNLILKTALNLAKDQGLQRRDDSPDVDARQVFIPLELGQVDAFCRGDIKNQALFLPTPEKNNGNIKTNVQPILRVFRKSETKLKIVLYITFVNGSKLKGYGFRFESPEGGEEKSKSKGKSRTENNISMHCYHHSQLIFSDDDLPERIEQAFGPEYSEFCPESIPAFPVPASNGTELLICALISIYGWNYFFQSWVMNNTASTELQEAVKRVRSASGIT